MNQLRVIAAWALKWWPAIVAATVSCLLSVSLWTTHVTKTQTPFGWPVAEVLGAALLAGMGLLWAPLLSSVEARKKSLLARLGEVPGPIQALLAATLVLTWSLAGLLFVDGAVGAARVAYL